MDRRDFVRSATLGAAAAALAGQARAAGPYHTTLKKAVIVGDPTAAALKPLKDAGLDGVETTARPTALKAGEARKVAEDLGLRIHSVLYGWAEFNSDKPEAVTNTWNQAATALRAAMGFGAETVLLVPCRVGGMAMPKAWEWKVEFDKTSGKLLQVVDGDNAPYKDYIAAQNKAWETSLEHVGRLIDVAQETGVIIALENVWNNLWIDPRHYAAFIDAFHSPWVKAYFDIGNMVKYSPSPLWIRTLGKRLAKCHVKDFKLNPDGHDGTWADPLDGSIDWPDVRLALDEIGYNGWLTMEGSDGLGPVERNRRMDVIVAGRKG